MRAVVLIFDTKAEQQEFMNNYANTMGVHEIHRSIAEEAIDKSTSRADTNAKKRAAERRKRKAKQKAKAKGKKLPKSTAVDIPNVETFVLNNSAMDVYDGDRILHEVYNLEDFVSEIKEHYGVNVDGTIDGETTVRDAVVSVVKACNIS